ncbi:MAG: OmpA family protein [Bacteroidetes bacterium]|nr:OmpA family protein [Bacteroidota bacterium]
MKNIIAIALALLLFCSKSFSQTTDFIEKFGDADYYFLFEEYNKALKIYQDLYNLDKTNANINYLIGLCYIQSIKDKDKIKSIPFLEFASQNINPKYKEGKYKETKAPAYCLYYLAFAYRLNKEFDKAIETYKKYLSYTIKPKEKKERENALKEIEACEYAKQLTKVPVNLEAIKINQFTDTMKKNDLMVSRDIGLNNNIIDIKSDSVNTANTSDSLNKGDQNKEALNIVDNSVDVSFVRARTNESCPLVSRDGSFMVFAMGENNVFPQELSFPDFDFENYVTDDIYYAARDAKGNWNPPLNIMKQLNPKSQIVPVCLSQDGKTLYLVQDDNDDGNIYTSTCENGVWTPIKKLNKNINTRQWETHASVTADGKTLYFTSAKRGGLGGLDIYKSRLDEKGEWGKAENLGAPVNTKFDEETPAILDDGKTLFFSSKGQKGIGGFDIFSSTLGSDGKWSPPLNVGYSINTINNDFVYINKIDTMYAYAPLNRTDLRSDFSGKTDDDNSLYKLNINTQLTKASFDINGVVLYKQGKPKMPDKFDILVVDSAKKDTLKNITKNDFTGQYNFNLSSGTYFLTYKAAGYKEYTKNLTLPEIYSPSSMAINVELIPAEEKAEILAKSDVIFEYEKNLPQLNQRKFSIDVVELSYKLDSLKLVAENTFKKREIDNILLNKMIEIDTSLTSALTSLKNKNITDENVLNSIKSDIEKNLKEKQIETRKLVEMKSNIAAQDTALANSLKALKNKNITVENVFNSIKTDIEKNKNVQLESRKVAEIKTSDIIAVDTALTNVLSALKNKNITAENVLNSIKKGINIRETQMEERKLEELSELIAQDTTLANSLIALKSKKVTAENILNSIKTEREKNRQNVQFESRKTDEIKTSDIIAVDTALTNALSALKNKNITAENVLNSIKKSINIRETQMEDRKLAEFKTSDIIAMDTTKGQTKDIIAENKSDNKQKDLYNKTDLKDNKDLKKDQEKKDAQAKKDQEMKDKQAKKDQEKADREKKEQEKKDALAKKEQEKKDAELKKKEADKAKKDEEKKRQLQQQEEEKRKEQERKKELADKTNAEKTDVVKNENKTSDTKKNQNAENISGATVVKNILFDFNKIKPFEFHENLNKLAMYLINNSNCKLAVEGYSDSQGEDSYKQLISDKRAEFIKNYLVEKGAKESNITVKGNSSNNPVASEHALWSRKYNRRAEFSIVENCNKLVIEPITVPEYAKLGSGKSSAETTGAITINNILFNFGKIKPKGINSINKLARYLINNPSCEIEISGHSDTQGDSDYKQTISQKRADRVKNLLIKKGVKESRLTSKGESDNRQIAVNKGPYSMLYNRRVEFKIIKEGSQKLVINPIAVPEVFRYTQNGIK